MTPVDASSEDGPDVRPGVVLAVEYRAVEGEAEQVASLLASMASAVGEHEPGCLTFDVSRSLEDPDRFLLYELYVDEEALEAHRATAHFRELVEQQVWPLLASREPRRYGFVAARGG